MGQHLRIFDVAVTNRSITNQEDNMMPLVLAHGGKILLGAEAREEIDAVEPLLDGVIPAIQAEVAFHDLLGKACGRCRARFGVAVSVLKDQIAKNLRSPHNNAVLAFVEKMIRILREILREHFAEPGFLRRELPLATLWRDRSPLRPWTMSQTSVPVPRRTAT